MSIKNIAEPELLRDFRLETPKATWNQLRSNSDANNAIKNTAIKKTGGLCVYCEQKLVVKLDYQIEHFYPKNGNDNSEFGDGVPNRAIEWDNLYPGCLGGTAQKNHFHDKLDVNFRTGANKKNKDRLTCGQRKKETHPQGVFISPLKLNNEIPIFLFNEADGSISISNEACIAQNIPPKLALSHISRLNLDSQRLRDARLYLSNSLRNQFNKAFEFDADDLDVLVSDWLSLDEDGLYPFPFVSLISSKYL